MSFCCYRVADRIFDALNGRVWVGHNINRFDNRIIRQEFERLGRPAPQPKACIDTLPLFRKLIGNQLRR